MHAILVKNIFPAVGLKIPFTVLALLFFLGSCQSLQHSKERDEIQNLSWEEHQQKLSEIKQWRLKGKLGFSFLHEGKPRLVSANIDWKKNESIFDMALSGPLGMGEFTIEKTLDITRLTNHKGDVYEAASPEQLFYQHTGIKIPWSDLEWWVLGLPAAGKVHKLEFPQEQPVLPESLLQSGWTVQFLSYQQWHGDMLPQKIKFTNGEIKATLIARYWELN